MFWPQDDSPWERAQFLLEESLLDRYLTLAGLLCGNGMADSAFEDARDYLEACKEAVAQQQLPTRAADRRRLLRCAAAAWST